MAGLTATLPTGPPPPPVEFSAPPPPQAAESRAKVSASGRVVRRMGPRGRAELRMGVRRRVVRRLEGQEPTRSRPTPRRWATRGGRHFGEGLPKGSGSNIMPPSRSSMRVPLRAHKESRNWQQRLALHGPRARVRPPFRKRAHYGSSDTAQQLALPPDARALVILDASPVPAAPTGRWSSWHFRFGFQQWVLLQIQPKLVTQRHVRGTAPLTSSDCPQDSHRTASDAFPCTATSWAWPYTA